MLTGFRARTAHLTALLAAALIVTVTACTPTGQAPERVPAALRSDVVVPTGMERYAVDQTTLTVTLPASTGPRNAALADKVLAAVYDHVGPIPAVFTTADPDNASTQTGPAAVASIDVALPPATDTAAATTAITEAAPDTVVTTQARPALALRITVPRSSAGSSGGALPDDIRSQVGAVLVGGYSAEPTAGAGTVVTYIGGGVTTAGLEHVRAALADAAEADITDVVAEPVQ